MDQFFHYYGGLVVFLHVVCAVIWVGGMIAIRFAVHPTLQTIADPIERLTKTTQIVGRFFIMVIPAIFFLVVSALIMTQLYRGTPLAPVVHMKEAIWTFMTLNFAVMFIRVRKAKKALLANDPQTAATLMGFVSKYMIPVNIALGIVALTMGITLRGL